MSTHPLWQAATTLDRKLAKLSFAAPVTHVYNPLRYAKANHREYVERFGNGQKLAIFLGMNPGPWGMAQTGIPFGDIPTVRDYLQIANAVGKPPAEHPKRPVQGLDCARVEVSGQRLWGAIKERHPHADDFFARFYIANYCPLSFMEESGKNRTPDKLPKVERDAIYAACDAHLQHVVEALSPRWVIGVGKFAETRARAAIPAAAGVRFGAILHPSPANPAANRGWQEAAFEQLTNLGICTRGSCH